MKIRKPYFEIFGTNYQLVLAVVIVVHEAEGGDVITRYCPERVVPFIVESLQQKIKVFNFNDTSIKLQLIIHLIKATLGLNTPVHFLKSRVDMQSSC